MRQGSVSRRVGGLNLRATASRRGHILDKLPPGASLEIGDLTGRWYAVRVVKTGKRGFVYAPDIEFAATLTMVVDKPADNSAPVALPPVQPLSLPEPPPAAESPVAPRSHDGGPVEALPPPDPPLFHTSGVWIGVVVVVLAVGWLLYWFTG